MIRFLPVLLVLAMFVSVATAGDLSIKSEKMQLSGVIGTIGVGTAGYWPLVSSADYGTSFGLIAALGTEAVAGGIGAKIDISLDFPLLNQVNFGWGGYGYNWGSHAWGWEGGFGKSWEVP